MATRSSRPRCRSLCLCTAGCGHLVRSGTTHPWPRAWRRRATWWWCPRTSCIPRCGAGVWTWGVGRIAVACAATQKPHPASRTAARRTPSRPGVWGPECRPGVWGRECRPGLWGPECRPGA
eukprot:318365-Chlamydomonas_euryale.AAC.13